MNKNLKVDNSKLNVIAKTCNIILESEESKIDALEKISHSIKVEFGDYFNPGILTEPDEISVNFIELMDQIVFEMEKQYPDDDAIRDYITDDLHQRLSIYLQVFIDINVYKNNLNKRMLTQDDILIIKLYSLNEYIKDLINTFELQQNLQKDILLTLLSFEDESLLQFYYEVTKGIYCIETRKLALLGLKNCGARFKNWHKLVDNDEDELIPAIDFIKDINPCEPWHTTVPDNYNSLNILVFYADIFYEKLMCDEFTLWTMEILHAMVHYNKETTISQNIYYAVSSILIKFDMNFYYSILQNDTLLSEYTEIIDILPRNYFDRVTVKLDMLGEDFVLRINELIAMDLIEQKDIESNIQTYLFWKSSQYTAY